MSTGGRQIGLRARVPGPPERLQHRHAERARQIRRLIEPAGPPPRRVERDWHREVRTLENGCPFDAHHRAESPRERSPALVLEGVHDGPKRAVVGAQRPGAGDGGPAAPASRASPFYRAEPAPGGQRITTRAAARGNQRRDAPPAALAHRTTCRRREGTMTRRAGGRGERRDERITRAPRQPRGARHHPRAARVNRIRASAA